MALIALVAWDTDENKRSKYTNACLESLYINVDWKRHRLVCVDNDSVDETKQVFRHWIRKIPNAGLITNNHNMGQASAINLAWISREDGQHLARIDNDIFVTTKDWLDRLEECIDRDPKIGLIGLKHKNLMDHPDADGWLKTSLHLLPHKRGESWLVVEKMRHILGSAQLMNVELFNKIGYLRQYGKWGLEDADASVRCDKAGFYSCYFHGAEFTDLDAGESAEYQGWKNKTAAEYLPEFDARVAAYKSGEQSIYYDGGFNEQVGNL